MELSLYKKARCLQGSGLLFLKNIQENSKKKQGLIVLLAGLIVGLTCACNTTKQTQINRANWYETNDAEVKMKTKIHHLTNDSSAVYIALPKNKFLTNNTKVVAKYWLFNDFKGKELVDSSSARFTLNNLTNDQNRVVLKKIIGAKQGQNYWLKVVVINELNEKLGNKKIMVYKIDDQNDQNYLTKYKKNNAILFDKFAKQHEGLIVMYRKGVLKKLTVAYFKSNQQLALPPFVNQKIKETKPIPDSLFYSNGKITIKKLGALFIKIDEKHEKGLTIVAVDENFPKLTSANELIASLRYITRNEEYQMLKNAENPKKAIDNFWLDKAGSIDRGKVLIKTFYGRVQRANQFFTSYCEGWQTDRGLIYIIYGQPSEVYQTAYGELWIYNGNRMTDGMDLSFSFTQLNLPFSTEHYQLKRDAYYETSWHDAVYEWRKGLVRNK